MLFAQFNTFLVMFTFGLVIASIFHFYNRIILSGCKKRFLIGLLDLALSIFFGLTGFLLLLFLNRARPRSYIFIAIFLGWIVYYLLSKKIFEQGEF